MTKALPGCVYQHITTVLPWIELQTPMLPWIELHQKKMLQNLKGIKVNNISDRG